MCVLFPSTLSDTLPQFVSFYHRFDTDSSFSIFTKAGLRSFGRAVKKGSLKGLRAVGKVVMSGSFALACGCLGLCVLAILVVWSVCHIVVNIPVPLLDLVESICCCAFLSVISEIARKIHHPWHDIYSGYINKFI